MNHLHPTPPPTPAPRAPAWHQASGQPAGHLGHGCEERQAALQIGHRLVGDAGGTGGDEVPGLLGIGGQMEIGEENLAGAEHLPLDGLGLLSYEAALKRDFPIMFGTLYFFTLLGLVMQLIGDITYMLVDPRIDFEARET